MEITIDGKKRNITPRKKIKEAISLGKTVFIARNGAKVIIITINGKKPRPIIAIYEDKDSDGKLCYSPIQYTEDGRVFITKGIPSELDLMKIW